MDATLLAVHNAIMNTNATGAPLMLPMTSVATSDPSDQSSSISNSGGTATKAEKAKKQREHIRKMNWKLAELQGLVASYFNGRMSQNKILKLACETVAEIKSEFYTAPRLQGFNEAIKKIESLAGARLESLRLTETNHLKQFEEMFGLLRELVMPGHSTANPTAPNPPATSTSATDKNADETEREKLKRRAQIGRDKVINYFGTLKQFIVENELVSSDTNWIPKFRILDAITSYIRNKPALLLPQHVKAQYLIGYEQGKYLGRIVATEFFKTYAHLRTKIAALHNLLDHQFGPLDYSIRASDIYLDQNACQKFMSRHPNLFACLNRHCHASHEDGQSDAFVATDSEHKIISDFINSQNLAPVRENISFLLQENVAAVKIVDEKKELRSIGAKSDTPSSVSPSGYHASDTEAAIIIETQTKKSSKKRPTIDEICSKLSAKKANNA